MSPRSLPRHFFCSLCCAALVGTCGVAYGQLTIRDVPLNRTAAWSEHSARMQAKRPSETVPPLQIPGLAAPAVSASRAGAEARTPGVAANPGPAAGSAPDVPREWRERIAHASRRHGVAEALLAAVLKTESNFNPNAVSPRGAQGAMQIMPDTGNALGLRDAFDPDANLDAGADYLASLLRRFSRPDLALAAYNAGPDAVRRHGGVPPYKETQSYVARVLAWYSRYSGWFR
jgi:soluble lytic murein transglycosylase-like protein